MAEKLITTIILSYKREPNIPVILDAIYGQTIKSEVWIWDNNDALDRSLTIKYPDLVIIRSSKNFVCRPRFVLPGMVQTPYIFNHDDDHVINNPELFEKLIELSKQKPDTFFGWSARKDYTISKGTACNKDRELDLVNTGISFYPTELFNKLLGNPYFNGSPFLKFTETEYRYGDDHWVSAQLSKKMTAGLLEDAMPRMSDHGIAISREKGHIEIRQKLSGRLFSL